MPDENKRVSPLSTRLPVVKILLGAFALFWLQRQQLFKALIATAVLMIVSKVIWQQLQARPGAGAAMVFLLITMALHVKFAVICHRLVLVDFARNVGFVSPFSWSDRETRFFGWQFVVYFLATLGSMVLMIVPFSLFTQSMPEAVRSDPVQILPYAALFIGPPATYLLGRFSLVLPATAVDASKHLRWAWNTSNGHGLQMMVIVGLLPWINGIFSYLTAGEKPATLTIVVVSVVSYLLLTIEIIALSLAYREFVQGRTDRT